MKILISILGFLNGFYMLLDGIFVSIKGKYIGPEKPGPWAGIFYKMNVDVFKLGWLFILLGCMWLIWVYALTTGRQWAYGYGIGVGILTLWYLPAGTIFSVVIIATLLLSKQKFDL